jgi:hypothetical protein
VLDGKSGKDRIKHVAAENVYVGELQGGCPERMSFCKGVVM